MKLPFRKIAAALARAAVTAGLASPPASAEDKTVCIGFQKYGKLVLLKAG